MEPLIDIRGVCKVYPKPGGGELLVLDDINLKVQEGEIVGQRRRRDVGDRERPGAVPAADGLRVLAVRLDVGDVGTRDGRGRAVEADAALLAFRCVAMDVDTVDDQVVRHLRQL